MKKKNNFTKKDFSKLFCCVLLLGGLFSWAHFSNLEKDFFKYNQANLMETMAVETSVPEEHISLIRQDCDGYSNCYTNLNDWRLDYGGIDFGSCNGGDLVCANKIAVAKIDGIWTIADSWQVDIKNWTADEDHYIKIYTTAEARHDGKWNTNKYRLFPVANADYTLEIRVPYTKIEGLQVGRNGGTDSVDTEKSVMYVGEASYVEIDSNILWQYNTSGHGLVVDYYSNYVKVKNSLAYDAIAGFYVGNAVDTKIYNCTALGNQKGFQINYNGRILYLKNCVAIGGSIGFLDSDGAINAQYCVSSDNSADNFGGEGNAINRDFSLVSETTDDFHLTASDNGARNKGMDLSSDLDYPVMYDIDGALRPGEEAWDIGFDEYGESPEEVVETDTEASGISNGSPTGTLVAGITETVLSVATNENATCRYAIKADLDYMEMTETFFTTGEMTHTQSVSGLADGQSYTYYIKCIDEAGNSNVEDYEISFSIAETADLSSSAINEGDMIRVVGDIDIYIVKFVGAKMFKRLILSPSVFESYGHLRWDNVKIVEQSIADMYTTSDLVRAVGDAKVYKLYPAGDTGERRWVETVNAFVTNGYDWDAIYEINEVDRDSYVEGAVL